MLGYTGSREGKLKKPSTGEYLVYGGFQSSEKL
jgi:hypothetical protein